MSDLVARRHPGAIGNAERRRQPTHRLLVIAGQDLDRYALATQCRDGVCARRPQLVLEARSCPGAAHPRTARRLVADRRHCVGGQRPIRPAEAVDLAADPALEAGPGMLAEIAQRDGRRIAQPPGGGQRLRIGMAGMCGAIAAAMPSGAGIDRAVVDKSRRAERQRAGLVENDVIDLGQALQARRHPSP